ncbi:hypothetical protein GPJ56_001027 [Histomonas meleagridis]|uniref:uncharacterized protein n=1 Tax=Histomonas meleagridis TaxID=135588 RepID=UPI003559ADD7|nr:hypothetical protein GPJ56_001027 [Histomonas meleagridis]KAH0804660.1 hypothetical protein GO595_002525 [Histomonas meleagridis]
MSDCIAKVEQRIKEETEKNSNLQKQLDAISPGKKKNVEIVFKPTVKFVVGFSRYEHTVPSNCSFEDLASKVRGKFDTASPFGYEDSKNIKMLIKNENDIKCCFREHFSTNETTIKFNLYKKEEVKTLMDLNYAEETPFGDNTFQFKLAVDGKDFAIFTSLPKGISRTDAFDTLKKLYPSMKTMSVIDTDNDTIPITQDVEWNYFINESNKLYARGNYGILLVQ